MTEMIKDMSILDWYINGYKNYFNFKGRANRKEFWWFVSINFLILIWIIYYDLNYKSFSSVNIYLIFLSTILVPTLSVTIRRLHDVNVTGWWILSPLVPFIGYFKLFFLLITQTSPQANKWGEPANILYSLDPRSSKL